jgi:transcription termination/antitermination protein NusG
MPGAIDDVAAAHFAVGDAVRICDGPFTSCNAVVSDVEEIPARLTVAVHIYGRDVLVELGSAQVRKCEEVYR